MAWRVLTCWSNMAKITAFCLLACLWIGVMAADEVACNGHGAVDYNGKCVCAGGYTGDTCDRCIEEVAGVECTKEYCDPCHVDNTPHWCIELKTLNCKCLPGHQPMINGICAPGCTRDSCTGEHFQCNSTSHMCECEDHYEMTDNGECMKACPGGCEHGVCVDGKCYCEDGYSGGNCQRPPICTINGIECENGGTCQNYQCQCKEGFAGKNCENGLTCDQQCLHGVCHGEGKDQNCTCADGYRGQWCDEPPICKGEADKNSCGEHGTCSDYKCVCKGGYSGEKCTDPPECTDDKPCRGEHQRCEEQKCVCSDGYSGEKCTEEPSCGDQGTCGEHGYCDGYRCLCEDGYTGSTCTECIEELAGLVCKKDYCNTCHMDTATVCVETREKHCDCLPGHQPMVNGVCLPGCPEVNCAGDHQQCNFTSHMCECEDGYEMDDGECKRACPGGCGDHGMCVDGKCFCKSGYYGRNCEVPPVCSGSYDEWSCGEHGFCNNYQCVCTDGYTGSTCTVKPPCADRCLHGTCRRDWYEEEECINCVDGYTGSWCEVPPVCSGYDDEDSCGEHGYCEDYKCVCTDGYSGSNCTVPCNGYGVLNEGYCECMDGYTGNKCEIPPVCSRYDDWSCGEHGYCTDGYQCVCSDGYTGEKCTEEPGCGYQGSCGEHGYCDGYRCVCEDGYSGEKCTDEPGCRDNDACGEHGYCDGYRCVCEDGYTGFNCTVLCNGHGELDGYKCVCTEGFIGSNCTESVSIIGGDDFNYYAKMFYALIGGLGAMIIIALVVVFLWKNCGNKNAYKRLTGSETSKQDVMPSISGDVSIQEVAPANDSTVKVDIEGLE